MKIGVLGTGDVGKALYNGFIAVGHEVMMGSRSATNEKAVAWASGAGPKASAVQSAGIDTLAGKILIDTTNPLDFSGGMPPKLAISGNDSAELPGGPPDMFVAGNDAGAKQKVTAILKDFGWGAVHDLGGIESSRYLEAMCLVWVLSAAHDNAWMQAFKLLRK